MRINYIVFVQLFVIFFANKLCETQNIAHHFATKTPYRLIANNQDKEIQYSDCTPLRIWAIIRHGTRNPSRKVIQRTKSQLTKIRDKILASKTNFCAHELSGFRNWSYNIDGDEEKFLVHEGEDELLGLAERMQNRFPNLMPDFYYPDYYKFKYTATQRTLKSAESFATGLFGRHNLKQITYPEALHKDPVLRFYKLCHRWRAEVDKNPEALLEVKLFSEGEEMQKVLKSVLKKTGLAGLSQSDIHLMYTTCAFETAWNKYKISPWCAIFDRQNIRVLEFQEDLEYYWIDGYGYEITHKQACSAFSDMIDHIDPFSIHPNATFYFTHSGTILKLLAHLGLYKDDFVLTHTDYNRNRNWRTSKIDAFASNLAFVTYQCKSGTKILVQHQEQVVHLPGCPQNEDLCDLDVIKRNYKDSLDCKFNEMCLV